MKLPNADSAFVPLPKVRDYLLSPTHPQGRFKSTFFRAMGFSTGDPGALMTALRQHAASCNVIAAQDTLFGTRYIVEGPLMTPTSRKPLVRSVWIVEFGQTSPRFVTAYPC